MTNLRLWVLVLALVSFGVGLASGTWFAASLLRPTPDRGPFDDYEARLVAEFQLSPERAQLLHVVLANYHKEIEEIKDRHMAAYTSAMEPELAERGRYYRGLIQTRVLPQDQRAKFERLAQGIPAPLSH
ncbi:MAG: hypothetical protein ACKVWV_07215 [Planctomycetota bacterium]